jgi:hypothetical protein
MEQWQARDSIDVSAAAISGEAGAGSPLKRSQRHWPGPPNMGCRNRQ